MSTVSSLKPIEEEQVDVFLSAQKLKIIAVEADNICFAGHVTKVDSNSPNNVSCGR